MSSESIPTLRASILAIDTDQPALHRHRAMLEGCGLSVIEAASYTEAFRIARVEHPAAVLLSIRLADAEGLGVCRELKGQPQTAGMPILIISDSVDSYPEALEAGADAWLQEPVDPALLLKTLRVLLSRLRAGASPAAELDHRELVDAVPAILCRNRADGHCVYCNSQAYEYTGMPAGSLEGLNWIELIHPEDRSRVRNTWLAGIGTNVPFLAEYRLRRSDGEYRWFSSYVIPAVSPQTRQVEWFGVSTEIHQRQTLRESLEKLVAQRTAQLQELNAHLLTEIREREQIERMLRESEERFRAIFDQASVGMVQGTLDGRFTAVNDRYCQITGYSRKELLTMEYPDITHPDDMEANREHSRKLLSGELREFSAEKRYLRKDGSTVWVKTFGTLVKQRGDVDLFVGIAEDISERRRAEMELRGQLEFDRVIAELLTQFATCSGSRIDEAIVDSLQVAARYCDADHALIIIRTGEDGVARCVGEWCASGVSPDISNLQLLRGTDLLRSAQKAYSNKEVVVHSLDELPSEAAAERAWLAIEGARALLHIPIEGGKRQSNGVIGCVVLHRHLHPRPWTGTDLTRVRMIGNAVTALLERKRTEDLLRQSEEKFSQVFHASPEAIVITSVADQKIADVNPRFAAISGYSRDEAIGKTSVELGLLVNAEERPRVWAQILDQGVLMDHDLTLRSKSGALRSGLLSSVVVTVHERQYLISTFRDLTERRRAEEELRRQAVFDSLMTGVLSEFVRCQTSELAEAVDGTMAAIAAFFSADHLLLCEVSAETNDWCVTREWCAPHVSPVASDDTRPCFWNNDTLFSDADVVIDFENVSPDAGFDLERCRAEGATLALNVPIKGSAGLVSGRIGLHRHGERTPWTTEDASRLRVVGNAIGGALQRIRAEASLLESERSFRDLADSAPMLTWISGPNKESVFYSRQAVEFAGLPLEQLIGTGWMELVHPDDRERYVSACFAAADARAAFSVEARFRRADGKYRWILVTGVPRMVDGVYQGHMGTGVDITDLKVTFENHLATQKLESLGVLAAGVAHDFNNLLGAIVARAESARTDLVPGSSAAEDVDQIQVTALRAAEIVSQLMAFARQENAPSTSVDLSRVVAEMLELLKISIVKTAILKTELATDLPLVRVNSAEIRQVIMNLIINAAEALEGKPGVITVSTACTPPGTGSDAPVLLEVADSGCGMTDDVKARIFDPFFTTRFAGRGLGLSAVQGIVRRHDGSIKVESGPGQGSRFTILLPPAPQ